MQITRRNVFYLSGFDPRGVRFYYQHYRNATSQYCQLTGKDITVSARQGQQWQAENRTDHVDTHYTFLAWDDLVRAAWIRSPWKLLAQGLRTYAYYFRYYRWRMALAIPRGPLFALLYPLLWQLVLPLLATGMLSFLLPFWLALLLPFTITAILGERLKSLWLLRLFIYQSRLASQHDAALDARLDQFVEQLVASFDDPAEEILLVAHSKGTILLFYLLEKLLVRTGGELPEHFRVVTLGHCIHLLSLLRRAPHLHHAMQRVAESTFYWADLGAPPDTAAYCKTDPFLPDYPHHRVQLHMRNPRFYAYEEPEAYRRMRRNKYQLHFRYLTPGQRPSPLDYHSLTNGPRPLTAAMEETA